MPNRDTLYRLVDKLLLLDCGAVEAAGTEQLLPLDREILVDLEEQEAVRPEG